ncbi:hypothetical protein KG088_04300 [Halomonas sp. TRM85114]|uniref:hypothetical protein n=1 Tax=Halomonas jincaotanensis TaxID=2810616 RepID=UPI001BD34426|nr:hypothetical protein [Halomonas jincaotanensis]MBS9402843.1 hypothetical protein [Halomonas jincaotanensis]
MKSIKLFPAALVSVLLLAGVATQASAAESDQVRLKGGTRENTHQYSVRADPQGDQARYRTAFEVDSPALRGNREGTHREYVKVESNQAAPQQVNKPGYTDTRVGSPRQGTRS